MNWAFVGASTIAGQYLAGAVRATGGCEVRWVVSGSAERAASFATTHGIAHSGTDLSAALADPAVGAVYISSTNEKHHAQALAAIAAGKHVLCEKPLATSVADARDMVQAAERAGVIFATNHHLRSAGSLRAIRQLVASGKVGKVLSLRIFHAVELPVHLRGWRLDNPVSGGGVIADLTVHNADTARFLLGEDPVSVVAHMDATGLGQGVEDSAMSVWAMPSGAMVFSHESFTHPYAASGIEVHGTKGSILARGVLAQEPAGEIDLITAQGIARVDYDQSALYENVARNFCAAVTGTALPAASGGDGVRSLQIAFAVRDAARSGQRQTVNYGVSL
ncbi:MAG: Gfo/Idh/MocA family oxidoreductase [Pseudotabrizicola sp.]|uniref:Gfo/Idh/MocA family protein n=1 Tax=Pseudotabrizicola sp. TaxID=2939647 RepID=UPI00273034A1|nr:Gfo/Idh/MocA family oxidoreductase [Pseudotabrizicola sp.]MDP2080805.1 Gfo/Idh/MocA family oxidoreductase [Pseudotabrizicola sp.]MDZ7574254.1 Gfo/Idh/MocA family oxidoreductase [Pseudotabrizicola sp.]